MAFLAIGISFVVAIALWWAINKFLLNKEVSPIELAVTIISVLVVVAVAGWITKKAVKKEGIDVSVKK